MVEQEDMSSNKRNKTQQSRMVAGVSVRISDDGAGDYDELLREAIRVALRMGTNPAHDDWPELYDRIRELIDAYIRSPEGTCLDGTEAPTSMLMCRLATCIADVIPVEQRPDHHQRERTP
jgi:hypothetical protein